MNFTKEKWLSFSNGNVRYSLSISGKLYSHRYKRLLKPQNFRAAGTKQLYYWLSDGQGKTSPIQIPKLVHIMFKLPLLPEENILQWDRDIKNNHISNLNKVYRGDQQRLIALGRKNSHIDKQNFGAKHDLYRVLIRSREGSRVCKYFRTKSEAVSFRDNYISDNFKYLLKY